MGHVGEWRLTRDFLSAEEREMLDDSLEKHFPIDVTRASPLSDVSHSRSHGK